MKIDVIEEGRHWRRSFRRCQLIFDGHYVNLMSNCCQKCEIIVLIHINLNILRTHIAIYILTMLYELYVKLGGIRCSVVANKPVAVQMCTNGFQRVAIPRACCASNQNCFM